MSRAPRPSLLLLTAISAFGATVAHGFNAAATAAAPAPPTRLGVAIKQDMASRDQASAGRDRTLDLREQAALATEARIKADLAARAAAAPKPGAAAADGGEQFDSLARVYQAMKPAAAAPVFQQLDMDVQMQVAKRMRDRSVAMIMANMTPQAATRLSMALARKSAAVAVRVLPAPTAPAAAAPSASAPAPVLAPAPAAGRAGTS